MSLDAALFDILARMNTIERAIERLSTKEIPFAIRQISQVYPTGTVAGTGSSYAAPANGSVTFTTVTGAKVLVFYSGAPTSSPGNFNTSFNVSGATTGLANNLVPTGGATALMQAIHWLWSPNPGSNTFNVGYFASVGTTVNTNAGSIISVFTAIEIVPRM